MNEVVFDLETKTFFDEIGSRDPSQLGVSIVSVYKRRLDENLQEIDGQMISFWEQDLPNLWPIFQQADRIVGFNSIRFDIPVLQAYTTIPLHKLPHFDILEEIKRVFGKRVSLNQIAQHTLGNTKNDNPINAVKYWQKADEQSLKKLQEYCESDVRLTRDIYDFGLQKKQLKFKDHWNELRIIEVNFSYPEKDNSEKQIGLF